MALHLRFAPSAERLVEQLIPTLRALWQDPFVPPRLLVPNPSLGKWLQLRLVDSTPQGLGCVLGLERATLERFLWQNLQPSATMCRMGSDALGQVLCALLHEDLLARSEFEPVRHYLIHAQGKVDPLRRVQLATRLARLFQEYEFNRPSVWDSQQNDWRLQGLDAHWLRGQSYFAQQPQATESVLATEKWQSLLYCEAMQAFHSPAALESKQWISLPHLHRLRREQGVNQVPWTVAPGPIFLFQVAKISHFHRNILIEISQMPGVELYVFLTNPCAEFWEDVDTRRHKVPRRSWNHRSLPEWAGVTPRLPSDYAQSDLSGIAPQQKDHPLLELWGHTGKENIYLWCPAAEWDFEYHEASWAEQAEVAPSRLQALQLSLLRRESALPPLTRGDACHPDHSLQIWESPDPSSEVEFLRAYLLERVAQNQITQLEDVVVYLPDPVVYLPHIQRVFGAYATGDPRYIPYSILGVPGADSLMAQGVLALLDILEGQFDRPHVFALLRNPMVQASLRLESAEVRVWEDWAEALGIFRGFDAAHRTQMGDRGAYAQDAHTFGLGLSRLLAGNLAMGSVDLGYGQPVSVYRDFASSDGPGLARFVGAVQKLYTDVERFLHVQSHEGMDQAVESFKELVWAWLGQMPREKGWNQAGEERVRHEFVESLPLLVLQSQLLGRTEMSLTEFVDHVRGFLPEELPAASKAWVGGVTFAPLRSGMVLPHGVVCVLGLDSDVFPGASNRSPSDLLGVRRLVGDPDPVRDNRFVFLELVHAARSQLVLSYRACHMQKEQQLQPSSVILELEAFLKSAHGPSVRHKLDWAPWEKQSPDQLWEDDSVQLSAMRGAPRYALRYTETPPQKQNLDGQTLKTTLFDLRTFFKNPLEYHLRHALGLDDDSDPVTLAASDEPLSSNALAWAGLQKKVVVQVFGYVFPLEASAPLGAESERMAWARAIATNVYNTYLLDGTAPEAQFAAAESEQLCIWAEHCMEKAYDLQGIFSDHYFICDTDLSLGRSGYTADYKVVLPHGASVWVRARHPFAWVPRKENGVVGLLALGHVSEKKKNADLWLGGVLQQLHLQGSHPVVLVQLDRKTLEADCCALKDGVSHATLWEAMHEWLQNLLMEMLVNQVADHLPCAAVLSLTSGQKKGESVWEACTSERLQAELEKDNPVYQCWLEAFDLIEARVPKDPPSVWLEKVQRRFAPFVEGWVHE